MIMPDGPAGRNRGLLQRQPKVLDAPLGRHRVSAPQRHVVGSVSTRQTERRHAKRRRAKSVSDWRWFDLQSLKLLARPPARNPRVTPDFADWLLALSRRR